MIRSEFERAKKDLKQGTSVGLLLRGNYGDYSICGKIDKIENERVYLTSGLSHHYKRIITMSKGEC